MKFAFLIMGDFDVRQDYAAIHGGDACIVGVADIEQACAAAQRLHHAGVGCIELCGAFGPQGARCVSQAVQNSIPVGSVTRLPERDAVYRAAFPEQG